MCENWTRCFTYTNNTDEIGRVGDMQGSPQNVSAKLTKSTLNNILSLNHKKLQKYYDSRLPSAFIFRNR